MESVTLLRDTFLLASYNISTHSVSDHFSNTMATSTTATTIRTLCPPKDVISLGSIPKDSNDVVLCKSLSTSQASLQIHEGTDLDYMEDVIVVRHKEKNSYHWMKLATDDNNAPHLQELDIKTCIKIAESLGIVKENLSLITKKKNLRKQTQAEHKGIPKDGGFICIIPDKLWLHWSNEGKRTVSQKYSESKPRTQNPVIDVPAAKTNQSSETPRSNRGTSPKLSQSERTPKKTKLSSSPPHNIENISIDDEGGSSEDEDGTDDEEDSTGEVVDHTEDEAMEIDTKDAGQITDKEFTTRATQFLKNIASHRSSDHYTAESSQSKAQKTEKSPLVHKQPQKNSIDWTKHYSKGLTSDEEVIKFVESKLQGLPLLSAEEYKQRCDELLLACFLFSGRYDQAVKNRESTRTHRKKSKPTKK